MSQDESYNLSRSAAVVGKLYPVLQAEDGEVLDGIHRRQVDPEWPSTIVKAKTPRQKLLVRVHANEQKRKIPHSEKGDWIFQARQILEAEVKRGTQKEIAKLHGYTVQWVSKYDTQPLRPQKERSDNGVELVKQ